MANTIHPTTIIKLCGIYRIIRFPTVPPSHCMIAKTIAMLIMQRILEKKAEGNETRRRKQASNCTSQK